MTFIFLSQNATRCPRRTGAGAWIFESIPKVLGVVLGQFRGSLMFQTKFSYLTHNHGRGGQQVLEISAPTGGASGYLQAHLASAGRVGRGRRAGGGGCKGAAKTLLSVGTRTRRCNQGGITHSPLHMGVSRPPYPLPKGPLTKEQSTGTRARLNHGSLIVPNDSTDRLHCRFITFTHVSKLQTGT